MRLLPLSIALFGSGLIAGAVLASQAPTSLRQAIDQRDRARAQADDQVWGQLTADDYVAIMPTGVKTGKQERLAEIRKQGPRSVVNQPQDESIRLYSAVAVRRIRSGQNWVMEIWTQNSNGWQVAESQQTTISK